MKLMLRITFSYGNRGILELWVWGKFCDREINLSSICFGILWEIWYFIEQLRFNFILGIELDPILNED